MYLDAVDSTGVSQKWIDTMTYWREWFDGEDDDEDDDDNRRFDVWAKTDNNNNSGTRRDAEYVVQCLQFILPLEIERNHLCSPEKKKTTMLSIDGDAFSDEAITVFCEFLQQPSTQMVALKLTNSFPQQQYQRFFETLSTHTSVKDLTIQGNSHCALWVCNLLLSRNDFLALRFVACHFRMADILILLPGFRRGQAHLQTLEIYDCDIRDEGVCLLLAAIRDGAFPVLTDLSLGSNKIKAIGLRCIAELGMVALCRLRKLDLSYNGHLLDDLESTTLFVQNMLSSDEMSLEILDLRNCGEHIPVIIKACETHKSKLQVLEICVKSRHSQRVRDQLVASLPKMNTLQKVTCPLFDENEQPSMVAAFQQNTSMVEFDPFGDSGSRRMDEVILRLDTLRSLVEPIMNRNQILKTADALMALQPKTHLPIDSKSGIWYMAFAKMGKPFIFKDKSQIDSEDDDDDDDDDDMGTSSDNNAGAEDNELLQDDDGNGEGSDSSSNHGDDNGDSSSNHCNYTGASAIFKILQKRPGILEKRLRRPTASAVTARRGTHDPSQGKDNGSGGVETDENEAYGERKRRRL